MLKSIEGNFDNPEVNELLNKVGISGAPSNAPNYIKKVVTVVTKTNGGEGAFREFADTILKLPLLNL